MNLEPDYKRTFPKVQYMPNDGTLICCIFIGAGLIEFETKIVQVRILVEIVGDAEKSKTGRRWSDRVKESVKYIGRNLVPLLFVLDMFFGM